MDLALISCLTLVIGVSLGLSGYGGFLIPAMLIGIMGMGVRDAVANALWSFVIPGIVGSLLYRRKDSHPGWSLAILLSIGTVPGTLVGQVLSVSLPERELQLVLGCVVLAAGLSLIRPKRPHGTVHVDADRILQWQSLVVLGAGALGGLAAVMTGAGGPLITVPILLIMGYKISKVVGAALLNSVVGAILGAVTLNDVADVDFFVIAAITVPQLIGVPVGVWLQHRMTSSRTVPVIAAIATVTGAILIWRALTA